MKDCLYEIFTDCDVTSSYCRHTAQSVAHTRLCNDYCKNNEVSLTNSTRIILYIRSSQLTTSLVQDNINFESNYIFPMSDFIR